MYSDRGLINKLMMKFDRMFCTKLLESSFRKLPETLVQSARDVVLLYTKTYRTPSKSAIKILTDDVKKDAFWSAYFKDIPNAKRAGIIFEFIFVDLDSNKPCTVKVVIVYGNTANSFGFYDRSTSFMVLFHESIKELSDIEIESVIIHEITHGFQQYTQQSPEYIKAVDNMQKNKTYSKYAYYTEPIETDAQMTELNYRIKREYDKRTDDIQKSVWPETKKIFTKKLRKFLLELKLFINSDLKSYINYEELPLPEFISLHKDFLTIIRKSPILQKKLKKSLANLYVDITGVFP